MPRSDKNMHTANGEFLTVINNFTTIIIDHAVGIKVLSFSLT